MHSIAFIWYTCLINTITGLGILMAAAQCTYASKICLQKLAEIQIKLQKGDLIVCECLFIVDAYLIWNQSLIIIVSPP